MFDFQILCTTVLLITIFLFSPTVKRGGHIFYSASTDLPAGKDEPLGRKRRTAALSSTLHPEEKRRIIGDTFIQVATDMIEELKLKPEDVYLGQGEQAQLLVVKVIVLQL